MKILIKIYSCYDEWGSEAFEERALIDESELEDYLIENYLDQVDPEDKEDFKKFISGELNSFYAHYPDDCNGPYIFHFIRYNSKEDALKAAKKDYDTIVALIEDTFKE